MGFCNMEFEACDRQSLNTVKFPLCLVTFPGCLTLHLYFLRGLTRQHFDKRNANYVVLIGASDKDKLKWTNVKLLDAPNH